MGRINEIEKLSSLLGEVLSGHGKTVLISGAAGVGKSRLVEEFLSIASQTGCQITRGRCIPGIARPLLPFEEAVLGLERPNPMTPHEGNVSRRGEPEVGDSKLLMARFGLEQNLFLLLDQLRKAAEARPVVVWLEDLHWIDSVSAQALHFISRNLEGLRIMVVATYRPEDLIPSPEERHPLEENLRIMLREEACDIIDLEPMSLDDAHHLIAGMLNTRVDIRLAKAIHEESEGNPLFMVEVIRLLMARDVLVMGATGLRLEAGVKMDIPSTVREVMLHRLESLSSKERSVIESASVTGMELDCRLLADVLCMPYADLVGILDSIEREHQLLRSYGGAYLFDHEKLRQVAYERISLARRKELHRLVGVAMEERGFSEQDTGSLAYHFTRAGVEDKCVQYSLEAGRLCLRRYANREAIDLFEVVRNIGERNNSYSVQRYEATEGLGDAYYELGDHVRSNECFESCLNATSNGQDRGRLLRKSSECWWPTRLGSGSKGRMNELMDRAEAIEELHPYDLGEICSNRAIFACWDGEFEVSEKLIEKAEALFKTISARDRHALEMINHADLLLTVCRTVEATVKIDEVEQALAQHPHPRVEMEAARVRGMILMSSGRIDEALEVFAKVETLAISFDDLNLVAWAHIFPTIMLEAAGRHMQALEMAERGMEHAHISESAYMIASAGAALALCRYHSGDPVSANEALGVALKHLKEVKWSLTTFMHGMVGLAQAEKSSIGGDDKDADGQFRIAIDALSKSFEHLLFEGYSRMWLGGSLISRGRRAEALQQYHQAIELFTRLENKTMVEEVRSRMTMAGLSE